MDNINVNVQTGEITNRPYSPEEKADVKARQDKRENERPMREWKEKMVETDSSMPRIWEDFLTLNGTDGLPQITKDRHNSKVALRATKPEEK